MKERKRQQDSHRNFHITLCASTDRSIQHSINKIPLAMIPDWSPLASAFDPFETLAVDSLRLPVLLDGLVLIIANSGRQAPERVFSVSKPLAFQIFHAVFREGLPDPTLVNAVMLALISAVADSGVDTERLGYQQKAIAGIRKRMDRVDEATSESTIEAILLLAGAEVSLAESSDDVVEFMIAGPPGRRDRAQLHMGAVQQLLNICKERGIYLTAGIKRAIFSTLDTRYFSPSFYRAPRGSDHRRGVFGDDFIEIGEDLHALQCIRNIPGAKKGDPLMMAYINNHTAWIQSRLGLLRVEGVVLRSCRLAAYICSVMLCCTAWCGLFISSHISKQLFEKLDQPRKEEIWEENLDLMLRLACIGGALAPEEGSRRR
ncbi:hypothetical protein LLEC1_03364, partial [Akanthomyces lecanii]